jgi:hypothetical protein
MSNKMERRRKDAIATTTSLRAADFINPFLQYRIPETVSAILLLTAAFVLGRMHAQRDAADRGRAPQLAIVVPTLFVLLVAGWVWLQGFLWLAPCSLAPFGTDWRFRLQNVDQRILPPLVVLTLVITVAVLILAVALALLRSIPRGGRSAMQH